MCPTPTYIIVLKHELQHEKDYLATLSKIQAILNGIDVKINSTGKYLGNKITLKTYKAVLGHIIARARKMWKNSLYTDNSKDTEIHSSFQNNGLYISTVQELLNIFKTGKNGKFDASKYPGKLEFRMKEKTFPLPVGKE